MFVIIWEYRVKSEHSADFEEIYAAKGAWAALFQKADGFQGTELLRNARQPGRYITIDRWTSAQHYGVFLSRWKTEYAALDARCADWTEQETLLGQWESIPPQTR